MNNTWKLMWSESAKKDLSILDKHVAKIIILNATDALDNIQNPLSVLIPLKYGKKGQYKYRMGKYRVICTLIANECVILAITVGHRKDVYKNKGRYTV